METTQASSVAKPTEGDGSIIMETAVEVQQTTPATSRRVIGRKRRVVEIFSVLCLEKDETLGIDHILKENLVLLSKTRGNVPPEYVLYNIFSDKHLQINSQGYLILTGPDRAIEVEKFFSVGPFYDVNADIRSPKIVWDMIRDNPFENFMCDCLESRNGFMVVKFSVYRDGLEAQLELTISDLELHAMPGVIMPLEVYGTVRTSNSAVLHSQAKSYLFDHFRSDNCSILELDPFSKAEVPLPLSRKVTVIPRESTLIVDVILSLRCSSGDISICNESVSFHASTRSNSTLEENTIKGQHAKVKVKVTWIEALEYDKYEGKEKEVIEDVEAVDEECGREDNEGAESEDIYDDGSSFDEEYISDDDSSFGSLKLRRLNSSQDVSTSVNDHHTTGTMEILDQGRGQGQGACLHLDSPERFKERYLEVFSVKLLDIETSKMDDVYGLIMVYTAMPTHLLFRRVHGYPSRINLEGFAILEGPRQRGWNVCDYVSIVPLLFKYQELHFIDDKLCYDLWRNPYYDKSLYDKLLCKILKTDIGKIEVNFAVYEDGVEVHLSVMLTDCCFSWACVHGTITASNSMLQNPVANTVVLEKNKTEADPIIVVPGKEISLPLSRPIVALPFDSILTLKFDLSSDDGLIIHEESEFPVQLGNDVVQTLSGNGCGVKV